MKKEELLVTDIIDFLNNCEEDVHLRLHNDGSGGFYYFGTDDEWKDFETLDGLVNIIECNTKESITKLRRRIELLEEKIK
jgi:hypothetical protein